MSGTIQIIGMSYEEFESSLLDKLVERLKPKQDEWLSQKEAAKYIGKTTATIINWEDKLNPDRSLGAPRYSRSVLEPYKK